MEVDLAVVGPDPQFGGGGDAQTRAFLSAVEALGRRPQLFYDAHPGLRGPRMTWRRVEALRQLTASRRIKIPPARDTWVVATHASDGEPAAATGRPYSCWIGTTVESEWRGRSPSLPVWRRLAASVSLSGLRSLERRVLEHATAVYATSSASRADLEVASGRSDVRTLPIPVDAQRFTPASEPDWRRTLDQPTLVFVGRADDPRKNIGMLLQVARAIPDVRLVLAGTPPAGPLPPNVEALGPVADTAPILRASTLFVLPSRQEGFGIVAAEALASGLPVITTPSGGPEELVRRSGGGLVTETFDPEELAAAVRRLLAQPEALAEMRRRGREYVEHMHSPQSFRAALDAALRENA